MDWIDRQQSPVSRQSSRKFLCRVNLAGNQATSESYWRQIFAPFKTNDSTIHFQIRHTKDDAKRMKSPSIEIIEHAKSMAKWSKARLAVQNAFASGDREYATHAPSITCQFDIGKWSCECNVGWMACEAATIRVEKGEESAEGKNKKELAKTRKAS